MKTCSICKIAKENSNYYSNKSRPDGLQTYCKMCAKIRSVNRYKDFSDDKKQEIKSLACSKRIRNRQFLWDFLKDKKCSDCPESDPIVLDFDHVVGKKLNNVVNMVNSAVGLNKIKEEIAKCEIRCSNCHRRKTAKQLGWYKSIVV